MKISHIAGLATIHLTAVPTFDGGQIFVEMQDSVTGIRLGHATMDVRYHAGGTKLKQCFPENHYNVHGIPSDGCSAACRPWGAVRPCEKARIILLQPVETHAQSTYPFSFYRRPTGD